MEFPFFAVARDLRGFGPNNTDLRVRVNEIRDGHAWIVTADLRSAGVPLTLSASQIDLEALAERVPVIAHPDALVF